VGVAAAAGSTQDGCGYGHGPLTRPSWCSARPRPLSQTPNADPERFRWPSALPIRAVCRPARSRATLTGTNADQFRESPPRDALTAPWPGLPIARCRFVVQADPPWGRRAQSPCRLPDSKRRLRPRSTARPDCVSVGPATLTVDRHGPTLGSVLIGKHGHGQDLHSEEYTGTTALGRARARRSPTQNS